MTRENQYCYYLMLANHWSFTGIGWQLGLESCKASVEDSLNIADEYPHVKVCINLDARAYEAIDKYFPETTARLRKYLSEGKTEIIGGTFGQPMGSMIGNESIIRQLVVGRKTVEKVLKFDMPSFLEEEEFTFPQLPQILLQSGFRYASLAQCDTWGKVGAPELPYNRIRWQGKDGSSIPALPRTKLYFHPPCVTPDVQELLKEKMRENIRALTKPGDPPIVTVWTEFGWEPLCEHNINQFYIENYKALAEQDDVRFVTLGEYLARTAAPADPAVYIAYDDFKKLLPWGIGADQLRRYDREIEKLLLAAERLDAIRFMHGEKTRQPRLEKIWKDLMISQSHDVSLCEYSRWGGGVIPQEDLVENYYGMQWGAVGYRYVDAAYSGVKKELRALCNWLGKNIAARADFASLRSFTVFNPTESAQSAVVKTEKIYLTEREKKIGSFCLKTRSGEVLPLQYTDEVFGEKGERIGFRLAWQTEAIPPMSYASYYLCAGEENPSGEQDLLREEKEAYLLENAELRARIDKKTGKLSELTWKKTGEKVLGSSFRFHGQPSRLYPEWARSANLSELDSDLAKVRTSVRRSGCVRCTVDVEFKGEQFVLITSYTLDKDAVGLQVRCRLKVHVPPVAADGKINGWQLGLDIPDGYWMDFSLPFAGAEYIVDAPFEVTPTQKDAFHASTFLDIVGKNTSLMIVHGGNQYFKKTEDGISNLLLREWESHFTAQCDWPTYSEYSYLLIPHASGCGNGERIRLSRRKDEKLLVFETNPQGGQAIRENEFLSLEQSGNIVLSSFRVEEGALEVRLFNASDAAERCEVRLPFAFQGVEKTDFLHRNREKIAGEGKSFCAELQGWQISTYRVSF